MMAACSAGADFVGPCFDGYGGNGCRFEQHRGPASESSTGDSLRSQNTDELSESCGFCATGAWNDRDNGTEKRSRPGILGIGYVGLKSVPGPGRRQTRIPSRGVQPDQ